MLTRSPQEQFQREGYVVVDHAVEPGLLEPLREAAGRVIARTRSADWPHRRDVPGSGGDIWGLSHLLHPDLGEPVFAEYMASGPVLDVCRDLLGPDLRLGLVNMLVHPERADYAIGWHRDMLREEMPPDQEAEALGHVHGILQWNTALYDDACLRIVPGSHRRAATPEERAVLYGAPMEAMPGEQTVSLKAGQGVYYNFLLLHRGIYPHGQPRATLHAALTSVDAEPRFRFHYDAVRWMETTPDFRESLPPALHPLYDYWLRFGQECRRETAAA